MMPMEKVNVPEGQAGDWKIERFVADRPPDFMTIAMGREWVVGESYTKLSRKGTVIMSDTPAELRDHLSFVTFAEGRVLVAGLGLGAVLQNLRKKKAVEHITVVEIDPDVIALVGEHYKKMFGKRLTIVHADIFEWEPPKGEKWDWGWFDIWPSICGDNLSDFKRLRRKFSRKVKNKMFWAEYECKR